MNIADNPHLHKTDVSRSTLFWADCFDVFPFIEDKSIDAIICDLPYGTTQNKWDVIIPLDKLWEQYERIIKDDGAIVLTASQPFTSVLVMSNPKLFKYDLVWDKVNRYTGFLNANRMPLRRHENVLIFYKKLGTYNKQMGEGKPYDAKRSGSGYEGVGKYKIKDGKNDGQRNPHSILSIKADVKTEIGLHPTQKPIELMEYLVKTYTNENEIVLDNTMGSGTTGLACLKTNRQFIGIEKEKQYYDVAVRRLSEYCGQLVNRTNNYIPPEKRV